MECHALFAQRVDRAANLAMDVARRTDHQRVSRAIVQNHPGSAVHIPELRGAIVWRINSTNSGP